MAGMREAGNVVPLLGMCLWLWLDSAARADDEKGGGFEFPCGYAITTILPPEPNGQQIFLYDMNDAGVAVGYAKIGLDFRSCIWSKEAGIQLLPEPFWVTTSYGHRINNNGWILVNGSGQKTRGYVLIPNDGGGYDTVEIQPASAPGWSYVLGINDKNEVVGSQSMGTPGGDPVHPFGGFRWQESTGTQDILVPGFVSTQCNDINDAGLICGTCTTSSQPTIGDPSARGFFLDDGGFTIVQPSAPFTKSEALRVNDDGMAIGTMRTQGGSGNPADYDGWVRTPSGEIDVIPTPRATWGWIPADLLDGGVILGTVRIVPGTGGARYPALLVDGQFVNLDQALGYVVGNRTASSFGRIGSILIFGCDCVGCSCMTLMESLVLTADLDCDGAVGPSDLSVLLGAWGSTRGDVKVDLTADGVVDGADLGVLLSSWTEFE